MSARPKVGESEEDLLKQEKEFLLNKIPLSVETLKKTIVSRKNDDEAKTPADFSHSATSEAFVPNTILHRSDNSPAAAVVSKVLKAEEKPATSMKKKSLFALRMERSRATAKSKETPINASKEDTDMIATASAIFGDKSYIVTGKDADDIHRQNVEQLSSLSLEEINAERQRLLSQLDPSAIKFLMTRREQNKSEVQLENITNQQIPTNRFTLYEKQDSSKLKDIDLESLPIDPSEAKQWLHMDVLETEKLEWMKNLPDPNTLSTPDKPYPARFDFQGLLMPYTDPNQDVNQGLHHHGDEPFRPGYTLQELMQLSRSSVQQQQILGLNAIGNILLKVRLGIYDEVLEENIIQQLLDSGLFLLLRFSMDEIAFPVVTAALTAMRNLLFNESDEASLDYLLGCEGGVKQPSLFVSNEEKSAQIDEEQKQEEQELKDFQLIQLDVVKGSQRTNLIVRLGYILDVVKGPPDLVLDLLTKISRHSLEVAEAVASCKGLLALIRSELLTSKVISSVAASNGQAGYGEPSTKALRLMRVLAAHSRKLANTLVNKFHIMEPVITYVCMSSPELPHIQGLVIGGFYLWQTLLSYGLTLQPVSDLFPILMKQLYYHIQLTSAVGERASSSGHELATSLFGIVEQSAKVLRIKEGASLLDSKPVFQLAKQVAMCLQKWLSELSSPNSENPSWSCVKMVGASFRCLVATLKLAVSQRTSDAVSFCQRVESLTFQCIPVFLKSENFNYVSKNILPCSLLLSKNKDGRERDAKNLPSLGSIQWGGDILPLFNFKAPQPLIAGLAQFLHVAPETCGINIDSDVEVFLNNPGILEYIQKIGVEPLHNKDSWFVRQEVYLLYHVLCLALYYPNVLNAESKIVFCRLAFKLILLIHADDKHLIVGLLQKTIFSQEFFKICGDEFVFTESQLSKLTAARNTYCEVLGISHLQGPHPLLRASHTSSKKGTEPALPVNWVFSPLLVLYGNTNQRYVERKSSEKTVAAVSSCLQLLEVFQNICPWALDALSVTARWCHLALSFLAGSDYFLDKNIRNLLQSNLTLLLQQGELDFHEELPGLSSFYDLYTELLLQYAAVSYGDQLFGAFILLPLQRCQPPQLRRMVLGEHAVVIRFLSTPIESIGVPIENYLHPFETDPTLLMPYLELLIKGDLTEGTCPVLYTAAMHHIANYIRCNANSALAKKMENLIVRTQNETLKMPLL